MDNPSSLTDVLPTVRVRVQPCKGNPEGVTEINKSDFDPKKHQLVDDGAQKSLDLKAADAPKPAGPFDAPKPA